MAIRFACPSCKQPIEVDDEWAGRPVGCPYCNRAVSAPAASDWPPPQVPMASPVQPTLQDAPPPPPAGVWQPGPVAPVKPSMAPWALTLALTCMVLSGLAWMAWFGGIVMEMQKELGPTATQQQLQEELQRRAADQKLPTSPFSRGAAVVGILCGLGGLFLAIRSLVGGDHRRVMAVIACLISVLFVCCQGAVLLIQAASRG